MSRAVNSAQKDAAHDRDSKNVEALLQLGDSQNPDANDQHIVKLVDWILQFAFEQSASDIHMEPRKDNGKVRFRIDGVLHTIYNMPSNTLTAVISRIKILGRLNVAEKRKPQDGKIRFRKFGPLDVELRVATLPTAGGMEDIVLRILGSGEPIALDALHLTASTMTRLKTAITRPHGLFFVCGPTGSGKTTTLHSILGHLNTPDTKIWTAEDPVEITQKGLRQVQVNRKVMDFATVMRAFLRADPDIIMVGEIRDKETAEIAMTRS